MLSKLAKTKEGEGDLELRSLDSFKMKVDPKLRDSEVEVFVKAVMNKVIEERLELEKSSKDPIVIKTPGRSEIRVYLHPVAKS